MNVKLEKLYNECVDELKTLNIDILDNSLIGTIDVKIAPRNSKRYGCCKQENPDKSSYYVERRGRRRIVKYDRFLEHHIEVNKWVMELDDSVIKNTIMHEIIHCFPKCNNHGSEFKKYASYINANLNYNISRLGNKEDDFKKSNVEYREEERYNYYKYKVVCNDCGQIFYRKRLRSDLLKRYRCGKCGGRLKI